MVSSAEAQMSQPHFNKGGFLAGRDLLLIILIVLMIYQNPPVPPEAKAAATESPGNVAVMATWNPGPVDVDLWVTGPGETNAIGYSNRAGKLFNLLRDDLGTTNDSLDSNFETSFSRGLPAGQYVVNIHCYSCRRGDESVQVKIEYGEGRDTKLLLEETLTLAPAQERTVISFKLDDKGNVVPGSVNRVFKPLRSATK
jgi:hypothetical protein